MGGSRGRVQLTPLRWPVALQYDWYSAKYADMYYLYSQQALSSSQQRCCFLFVCFCLISWFVCFPKTLFHDVMTVFELLNSVRETKWIRVKKLSLLVSNRVANWTIFVLIRPRVKNWRPWGHTSTQTSPSSPHPLHPPRHMCPTKEWRDLFDWRRKQTLI